MTIFSKYDEANAPDESAAVLASGKERYGFIPNLAAYIAESPLVLGAVLKLSEQFDQSSLSPQEQQLVLLVVSALNGCSYCKTAHIALGKKLDMSTDTLKNIIAFEPLKDSRMEALRTFTSSVVEEKGWVDESTVQNFLDAGFTKAQVFEVVLGVALKTITNYSNHIVGAKPNEEFLAMAGDALSG
jgi:uncharacterized peroxidase-related enzyme